MIFLISLTLVFSPMFSSLVYLQYLTEWTLIFVFLYDSFDHIPLPSLMIWLPLEQWNRQTQKLAYSYSYRVASSVWRIKEFGDPSHKPKVPVKHAFNGY